MNFLYKVALTWMSKLTNCWTSPIVQGLILQIMMNPEGSDEDEKFNPVNREKLVQKVEKHPRPENLNSLKIKKSNPEI